MTKHHTEFDNYEFLYCILHILLYNNHYFIANFHYDFIV